MRVKAVIYLKDGVLDPQAKAIFNALHSHNFTQVSSVSLAKEIILDIDSQNKQEVLNLAKQMCEELLANLVIEDYKVEIVD